MQLEWIKSTQNEWLNPRRTNWDSVSGYGVYIIWTTGTILGGPTYLKVGQGDIRSRMQAHLRDTRITRHGELRFTFAKVNQWQMNGVERYLGDVLQPLVAERFPDSPHIRVNLPNAA